MGVKSARGGFDSHAFPPLLALALGAWGLAIPIVAFAQGPAPGADSVLGRPPVRIDSLVVRQSRGDSVITVPQEADTSGNPTLGTFDQPRFVMARSLLFPGWGQAHNHAWYKAIGVAAAEWYLIGSLIADNHALKDLNDQVNAARAAGDQEAEVAAVNAYNDRLDSYVAHQWWLGGVLVYSLADAYVDAHFVNFKFEFEHDRALRGHTSSARISVEKRF